MEQKDIDRIIEMVWEDRTPFEAIHIQFGFTEADVITLMRRELKRGSFNLWRKRVHSGISQKHAEKRNPEINRFKCSRQRNISMNKISKRWCRMTKHKLWVILVFSSHISCLSKIVLFQNVKPFTWLKKYCFSNNTTFTNRKLRFTEPAWSFMRAISNQKTFR